MSDDLRYEYILEAFSFLPDWETRYQFIEDLGRKLPIMDDGLKTDENRVHGCMSMVWIKLSSAEGKVVIEGDSDTSTIKGIVAILVAIHRDQTAQELLDTDTDARFDELGLFDHLSPTRHVGVYAIVEKIRDQAKGLLQQTVRQTLA
jgi:cysteine desulfuration protein SufE